MKFTIRYNEVPSNPTIEFADQILLEAKKVNCTEIESIGGGSTIDVGKYVAFKLDVPHTAIPTTAGTGSEVTKFAVFVKDGKKVSLSDERLIPNNYTLDASRVVGLDALHTAASGLDALSQGIESYWAKKATNDSRYWSKKAIRLASKNLIDSYDNPNNEYLRLRMLQAANYSGRAINIAGTSICHAISYALTTRYEIPHGIACAHTLPFFIEYFDFKLIEARVVRRIIKRIKGDIQIKYDIDFVAREAMKEKRATNTPRVLSLETVKKALWG